MEKDIDILTITETWIKTENTDFVTRDICPSGYLFSHIPRVDRIGGGIAILYKNSFKIEQQKSSTFKSFEFMEVLLHTRSCITRIVIVYRPPISSANGQTYNQFFNDFSSLLERMVSSSGELIITGDFNFHIEDKTNTYATRFLDMLDCFNLTVLDALTPTHRNNHVLDLIITRSNQSLAKNIYVHDPAISDHYAVYCNLSINKPPIPKKVINYRKLCSIDMDTFLCDIKKSSLCQSPASGLSDLCDQYDSYT